MDKQTVPWASSPRRLALQPGRQTRPPGHCRPTPPPRRPPDSVHRRWPRLEGQHRCPQRHVRRRRGPERAWLILVHPDYPHRLTGFKVGARHAVPALLPRRP